ncbi:hypothetical protein X975_12654, partial [Stegodyphus mimosarum]
MAVYRNMHIKPATISMVPVYGYTNKTNYSVDGIRWLDYVAYTENIKIQHALNGYGECKIGGVSVDGFCGAKKTIYQFHVSSLIILILCFFSGFLTCFE